MNESEVQNIYESGDRSIKNFAGRLLRHYFTKHELAAKNVSVCGRGHKQKLDPIRVDYIRSHIADRNGGQLSEKEWTECKGTMAKVLADARVTHLVGVRFNGDYCLIKK
jgi:hypothetical protein